MSKRQTGLVVGKDFRPPEGARPSDWCYLIIDLSERERVSLRIKPSQIDKAEVGDIVKFRRPRQGHAVSRLTRVASDPSLLPPVSRAEDSR